MMRIIPISALIALVFSATAAAQVGVVGYPEICGFLPANGNFDLSPTTQNPAPGLVAAGLFGRDSGNGCANTYGPPGTDTWVAVSIVQNRSSDAARAVIDTAVGGTYQPLPGLGDYAKITGVGDPTTSVNINFQRGCYFAHAYGPSQEAIVAILRQVDEQFLGKPCPEETTEAETIVNVRDPSTGSWVPWLLVPGIGLVIWAVGKLKGRKKPGGATPGAAGQAKQEKPDERKVYDLDIRTQDDRMDLAADGQDILWVYAQVRCNKPEVNTEALTASVTFTAQGADTRWLSLGAPQTRNGFKAVPVSALPPSPDAELAEGKAVVMISTVLDGTPVNSPVTLELHAYALEFF